MITFRHPRDYALIQRQSDEKLFRYNGLMDNVPNGFNYITYAYDKKGKLLPQFWALERWGLNNAD